MGCAMIKATTTWQNNNPNTIWNTLARKLGREPTNAEAAAEVRRILEEVTIEMATNGKLPYQRGRGS